MHHLKAFDLESRLSLVMIEVADLTGVIESDIFDLTVRLPLPAMLEMRSLLSKYFLKAADLTSFWFFSSTSPSAMSDFILTRSASLNALVSILSEFYLTTLWPEPGLAPL